MKVEKIQDILRLSDDYIYSVKKPAKFIKIFIKFIKSEKDLMLVSDLIKSLGKNKRDRKLKNLASSLLTENLYMMSKDIENSVDLEEIQKNKEIVKYFLAKNFDNINIHTRVSIYKSCPVDFHEVQKYNPDILSLMKDVSTVEQYRYYFDNSDLFYGSWINQCEKISTEEFNDFLRFSLNFNQEDKNYKPLVSEKVFNSACSKLELKENESVNQSVYFLFNNFTNFIKSEENSFSNFVENITKILEKNKENTELFFLKCFKVHKNDIEEKGYDKIIKKIVYQICFEFKDTDNSPYIFKNINTLLEHMPNLKYEIEKQTNKTGFNAINQVFLDSISFLKNKEEFSYIPKNLMVYMSFPESGPNHFMLPEIYTFRNSINNEASDRYEAIHKHSNYYLLNNSLVSSKTTKKTNKI